MGQVSVENVTEKLHTLKLTIYGNDSHVNFSITLDDFGLFVLVVCWDMYVATQRAIESEMMDQLFSSS